MAKLVTRKSWELDSGQDSRRSGLWFFANQQSSGSWSEGQESELMLGFYVVARNSPARSELRGFVVPHDLSSALFEPEQASFIQAPGPQHCAWGALCSAVQRNSPEGRPRSILGNNPAAR